MGFPILSIDDYRRLFPDAIGALAMHEALRQLFAEDVPLPERLSQFDGSVVEAAWQGGRSLVERRQFAPDAGVLRDVLRRVAVILQAHLPAVGPLDTLADAGRLGDTALLELAGAVIQGEPHAVAAAGRACGAAPAAAAFAVAFATSVFFHSARRRVPAGVNLATWTRPACPLCGAIPVMAKIWGDGLRMAYCHQCGCHWQIPADRCLTCGATDTATRVRVEMSDDPARWLEVCRCCRQHLKLVDENRLGAVPDLYYEDVVTSRLDEATYDGPPLRPRERELAGRP